MVRWLVLTVYKNGKKYISSNIFYLDITIMSIEKQLEERLGKDREKVERSLGENQIKILALASENYKITISELSNILKISITGVEKNIAKLKKMGILKRIGSAKSRYWEVLKK